MTYSLRHGRKSRVGRAGTCPPLVLPIQPQNKTSCLRRQDVCPQFKPHLPQFFTHFQSVCLLTNDRCLFMIVNMLLNCKVWYSNQNTFVDGSSNNSKIFRIIAEGDFFLSLALPQQRSGISALGFRVKMFYEACVVLGLTVTLMSQHIRRQSYSDLQLTKKPLFSKPKSQLQNVFLLQKAHTMSMLHYTSGCEGFPFHQ